MGWLEVIIGDKDKQRARRRKKIKRMKDAKTVDPKEDIIKKKKLGYKAVKEQRKKKRLLKEAGK